MKGVLLLSLATQCAVQGPDEWLQDVDGDDDDNDCDDDDDGDDDDDDDDGNK